MNFFFRYINNNNNKSNNSNAININLEKQTFDLNDTSRKMESSDKQMKSNKSNDNYDELGDENETLNGSRKTKKRISSLTDNKDVDGGYGDEKSNPNESIENETLDVNNISNDKLSVNDPLDDKVSLVTKNREKVKKDSASKVVHTSRRNSKSSNSISRNFIRRLLSCGGSCTGNRSTSNSLVLNNTSGNHGLFKSGLVETRKSSESSQSLSRLNQINEKKISAHYNESQKYKSDTKLNLQKGDQSQQENIENSSYESIIDKFLHTNNYENYKLQLSPNNLNIETNHKITNDSTKQNESNNQVNASNKEENAKTSKLVPILKINDDYLSSPNSNPKKEFRHPSNTDESVSVDDYEDEDDEEEIIEIGEDEDGNDEDEDEAYEEPFDPLEDDSNDLYSDNNPDSLNANVSNENNTNKTKIDKKSSSKPKSINSKQNDDSNLKTTHFSALNLMRHQTPVSFHALNTTPQSHKSNDLDSSIDLSDPFQIDGVKNSPSSFSIKNNLDDENFNSANNGANLVLNLIIARKQKAQNSNSSIGPLSNSPSPLFLVTSTNDSEPSSSTLLDTTKQQNECNNLKSEETDEINDISKVKIWLNETNHHHQENYKDLVEIKSKSENTDSAIDVNSNCSNPNVSKSSSSKLVRVRWESFNKYYQSNYQLTTVNLHNEQNYQIASMSLEQIMSLRKLALLQFSKILERQHSTMTRLFSKNKDIAEFRRVYDSVDSLRVDSKSKSNLTNGDANLNSSNENYESLIIENKKIIHQLGAPNERKRASKGSSFRNTETSVSEIKRDEKSVNLTDSNQSYKVMEKVVTINTKSFSSMPSTVFGTSLTAIMQHTGQPLPHRILEAMKHLRKIAQNEIGVFRKNGVKTRINKLKDSINRNESIDYQSSEYTPFDIADTIKLYFRELPECLITNKLSDILLSNYDKIRSEERKIILQQVMLLIPDENRLVLQTLLLFLHEIAKAYKVNQMSRYNLAVCFSPVIFRFNFEKKSKLKQPIPSPVVASSSNTLNDTNSIKTNTSNPKLRDSIDEDKLINTKNTLTVAKTVVQSTSQPELKNIDIDIKRNESENKQMTPPPSATTPTPLFSINESTLVTTSITIPKSIHPASSSQATKPTNYKRKYSEKINKAASSIVNFGAELNKSNKTFSLSDSSKGSFESMNKVIQACVSDMIKYSVELFNVPIENFDKFKLTFSNSDPPTLDHYYDINSKTLKKSDFFVNNVKLDKNYWNYLDKFEDVSIYFCKNENSNESTTKQDDSIMLHEFSLNNTSNTTNSLLPVNDNTPSIVVNTNEAQSIYTGLPHSISSTIVTSTNFLTLMPQKFETFSDKLKLWKCCTLIKQKNVTLDTILNRIMNERHLWDDDFVEGKQIESLDENTDLYLYSISFMPPHPHKEFLEIRHISRQNITNIDTIILTSTSIKHKDSSVNIRSNMMISKYVIEKLIATDTTTTFKITHYIKLDYKGFTLEFYNKTFAYMMARLLYNLKMSFKSL